MLSSDRVYTGLSGRTCCASGTDGARREQRIRMERIRSPGNGIRRIDSLDRLHLNRSSSHLSCEEDTSPSRGYRRKTVNSINNRKRNHHTGRVCGWRVAQSVSVEKGSQFAQINVAGVLERPHAIEDFLGVRFSQPVYRGAALPAEPEPRGFRFNPCIAKSLFGALDAVDGTHVASRDIHVAETTPSIAVPLSAGDLSGFQSPIARGESRTFDAINALRR